VFQEWWKGWGEGRLKKSDGRDEFKYDIFDIL
jgi:hypothetical protein